LVHHAVSVVVSGKAAVVDGTYCLLCKLNTT